MIELGVDASRLSAWFEQEQDQPYVLIRVSTEHAESWAAELGVAVRRCYVTDEALDVNSARTGLPKAELLAAKLPDPGSTMAGDFGEILVSLYQATQQYPEVVVWPKKWRLKQERSKPAPHSDVIQFVLPSWPQATEHDLLLCSEVKTKSTDSNSTPVASAIEDCEKDRTSRLAKTLAWLRERALSETLGMTTIAHLERFINATDHPPAKKWFRAVVVVCASLTTDVLADVPENLPTDFTLVVISVPDLKHLYESVFGAAHATVAEQPA